MGNEQFELPILLDKKTQRKIEHRDTAISEGIEKNEKPYKTKEEEEVEEERGN